MSKASTAASTFQPIPKIPDFPEIERRMLDFWVRERTFAKLRAQNEGGPKWSFLDGPITANNPMGVHHAWGRTYKDMFQRYHAMLGHEQRYQNGFDCQGLWVEVEVEKALGFETRQDILKFGLEHFTRRCKERVLTFAARQTEQSIRLGYWTDWDDPATLLELRDALEANDGREVTITTPTGATATGTAEQLVGRLGNLDWGGSYFTFSDENNYTIWAFLKKVHEEGFLYRGTDVMPWCCRCGTGLSQMEVAEGRKITRHTSVFVRFPLRGRKADAQQTGEKEALLVWTTTPWTLTSNVAAAVNPEMTYLRLRHGDWILYVGKENYERQRVQQLEAAGHKETAKLQTLQVMLKGTLGADEELEILGEVPGSELVGLAYEGPFDHLDAAQRSGGLNPYAKIEDLRDCSAADTHRVLAWDEVSGAEGTGIVHMAPGCGAEDNRVGRDEGLVVIAPLSADGHYLDGFGPYSGRHVLGVTDDIVADLKERGLLVAKESYPHVYPHCWRCKEELVFRLVDEWFIDMQWRDRIQKIVADIRWIPGEGEAREQDWLKNMGDWMISKKRFWGLALPIWVCDDCESFTVIGSRDELQQKAFEGWDAFDGHTPHRPWVDQVKVRCADCGGVATRVQDVGNPWLDAGIVPFSTLGWGTDRETWQQWFPADFVVESFPGQFRNWFYSLLAMSAMMADERPFKTLLGHALVHDARGHEMHKSAGNAIAFDEAAEVMGAEVMRYMYAARNPTHNLNFPDLIDRGDHGDRLQVDVRRRLLTLWNCYSFFVTYAGADNWSPAQPAPPAAERPELDRWILSRLQHLIGLARQSFEDFAVYKFMGGLEGFLDDLSNWYLRRSRRRFWGTDSSDDSSSGGTATPDKAAAYRTLYDVLETTVRLLAPVLPFVTEEIYQNLVRSVDADAPASIHLCPYPEVDVSRIDDALEARLDCVIRTKELGLALRMDAKVKTRQPLGTLLIRPRDATDRTTLEQDESARQVLEECNIKELKLIDDEAELVRTEIKANFKALGPRYGKAMKAVAAHLGQADAKAVQAALDADGRYSFTVQAPDGTEVDVDVERSDLQFVLHGDDHLVFTADAGTFAALDTTITPELEAEGIARDFNRGAQDQRKALDLQVSDRIHVRYSAPERVRVAIETHAESLKAELLAETLEAVDELREDAVTVKVAGEKVRLTVERI